ncbi:MAG: transcriptional regulator [Candidatus Nealsonbacteria bacterium RBG_13_38_11]|uniref:Probable transcriptional regulatory protein A2Z68_02530 n=1 Tax=Candidatus Nealsonbacteria bacterium RBG_13_38_11 TaxID=1801662 RepID=A0A1G2DZC8_9BACT|nr:MAG: transcriptional regulator [Candidatus Nealsonbacteria bacterium RBG_13_38_11]
MSGHSHAKTIKHQKELTDKKRGQMFSKMSRLISVAVKEGGPNVETNSKLRLVFEMAKKLNMPKENVERAIKRGSNEPAGEALEEVSFEAYGPGNIAMIITGITDNKNRTLGEIKQILNQYNGKLVGEGSVKWLFEKKGYITADLSSQNEELKNKEKMEMLAIEAGAEDIDWQDNILNIYTTPEALEKTKKSLEEKNFRIESVSLDWLAKEDIETDKQTKESCQKLFDALDESDSVQGIYSNLKID